MGAYEYRALNAEGEVRKGVMEADSDRQVRNRLKEEKLIPLKVKSIKGGRVDHDQGKSWLHRFSSAWGSVSFSEMAVVLRQLAIMVVAGLPLGDVLYAVGRQSESKRMGKVLAAVRSQVVAGHDLATAMDEFPQIFPSLYRAMVEAGEKTGHLGLVLERLADYTEERQQMRQRIQMALIYPALLTLVSLLVVGGLLVYVVPDVVKIFEGTGQELPGLTRGLIALSDGLSRYGGWLAAFFVAAVLVWKQSLKQPKVRRFAHSVILRMPLVGRLAKIMNGERFTRSFGILLASGVSVLEAFRISAKVIPNIPIRESVEKVGSEVREGGVIHHALQDSGYFPPVVVQLVSSGEATGRLPEMLDRAANAQAMEVNSMLGTMLALLEPLLILVMGGMVMLIVLAILLPIMELNQLVGI